MRNYYVIFRHLHFIFVVHIYDNFSLLKFKFILNIKEGILKYFIFSFNLYNLSNN